LRGRFVFPHTAAPAKGAVSTEVAPLTTIPNSHSTSPAGNGLHHAFLELLPRLQTHAEISFRHVRCPQARAEKIAEAVALAWRWFLRLKEQGRDVNQFIVTFCRLVVRAVRSGRKITSMHKSKDVLNELAQQRFGFKVERLPASNSCPHESLYSDVSGQEKHDAYEERLQENMVTPIPEQVAFRLDWPRFLASLTRRDQEMAHFLSLGNSNKHASRKFGLTPGRVTQLRQQWLREWKLFEEPESVALC